MGSTDSIQSIAFGLIDLSGSGTQSQYALGSASHEAYTQDADETISENATSGQSHKKYGIQFHHHPPPIEKVAEASATADSADGVYPVKEAAVVSVQD